MPSTPMLNSPFFLWWLKICIIKILIIQLWRSEKSELSSWLLGFGSFSHVPDRWEASALLLLLSISDSIYGIKSSYPLLALLFSWFILSSESDSLASGRWDYAAIAFLHDRHFWTSFSSYRKINFNSNYQKHYGFKS